MHNINIPHIRHRRMAVTTSSIGNKGLTGNLHGVEVLPNTASQLVEAIFKQNISRAEVREMAAYLDERYGMGDYVPTKQRQL